MNALEAALAAAIERRELLDAAARAGTEVPAQIAAAAELAARAAELDLIRARTGS